MNFTSLLCWNFRGEPRRDTSSRVLKLLRKYKPLMLCLVETRPDDVCLRCFCMKLGKDLNLVAIVASGVFSGIITIWISHLGCVTLIIVSHRALHMVISYNNNVEWMFLFIYNATRVQG